MIWAMRLATRRRRRGCWAEWRAMLHECFEHPEQSRHPVYVALQPTIKACELPIEPFDDLITAFEQDQVYTKHESLKTLEEYSKYSANPVGQAGVAAERVSR